MLNMCKMFYPANFDLFYFEIAVSNSVMPIDVCIKNVVIDHRDAEVIKHIVRLFSNM